MIQIIQFFITLFENKSQYFLRRMKAMSLKQYISEVERVSYNIEKILEKTDSNEEKVKLFFAYYRMLTLLQDSIITATSPKNRTNKRI